MAVTFCKVRNVPERSLVQTIQLFSLFVLSRGIRLTESYVLRRNLFA